MDKKQYCRLVFGIIFICVGFFIFLEGCGSKNSKETNTAIIDKKIQAQGETGDEITKAITDSAISETKKIEGADVIKETIEPVVKQIESTKNKVYDLTERVMEQASSSANSEPVKENNTAVVSKISGEICFDFEQDLEGWEIPAWAMEKEDYVAKEIAQSKEYASKGIGSMKINANFLKGVWSGALVEVLRYFDMTGYQFIKADVYIPKNAPEGLRVKLILTVGNEWKFVEMNTVLPVMPGEWVTIGGNIAPNSYDWKRTITDSAFAQDIRKISVRIECNGKVSYEGPIYIDNIRAEK
ncbi:hypothetical protein OMAG_000919 [Candidatus Omnitrophus magneticus]|uniref:Uncharacterized protein n=1 Tax=Candidatus Omnitrophus magneticus TaxID=1609969 RepID=A0A0F0CPM9_9BACT|nr:hypothetical protein OMAG_000919 [Candidatus Omnitrophus magneticus]